MTETLPSKPRWKRVLVRALGVLLIAVVTVAARWFYHRYELLSEIPDVGFPFDPAILDGYDVPDDQNAYTYYRRASNLFRRVPESLQEAGYDSEWQFEEDLRSAVRRGWHTANEAIRDHLEVNRPAFEEWRRGATLREARYHDPRTIEYVTTLQVDDDLRRLLYFAVLEVSRLSELGEHDRALELLVAGFRSSRHPGRYGSMMSRIVGINIFQNFRDATLRWASYPDVTSEQLRRAAQEIAATLEMTPPIIEPMLTEYLIFQKTLRQLFEAEFEMQGVERKNMLDDIAWYFRGEPEASRRLADHFFVHLANYYTNEYEQACKPCREFAHAETILLPSGQTTLEMETMGELFDRSNFLRLLAPNVQMFFTGCVNELVDYRCLGIALALQEHHRIHGRFPDALDPLVPEFLPEIPCDPRLRTGEPLLARFTRDGVIVYSVHYDGEDNGGQIEAVTKSRDSSDWGVLVETPIFPRDRPLVAPIPVSDWPEPFAESN